MNASSQSTSTLEASQATDAQVREWIEEAAAGDMAALERLYHRYLPEVRRHIGRLVGPRPEVDELLEEVFVQAHGSLGELRHDAQFNIWLHRVTRDVLISRLREGKKTLDLVDLEPLRAEAPIVNLEVQDQVRALYAVLDQVSAEHREAFVMFEFEGMKLREIAEFTKTPAHAVDSRVRHTREKLHSFIEACQRRVDGSQRLGILLEAAAGWQPEADAIDADALFARIVDCIDREEAVEPAVDETSEGESGARRWAFAAAGLAAGVLLTLGAVIIADQMRDAGAEAPATSGGGEVAEEARKAEAATEESPSDEPRLPPNLDRLQRRADRARDAGDHHAAIRSYRQLLHRLPPAHPTAATVHLDLAQLYLHRLNSPGRAAPHLRVFIDRWPTDPAAASVRRQLCKIADKTGREEPECAVER